jgi:transposase
MDKLHLMCGTSTHIVTSVEVSDGYQYDYPYYKPLVDKTAQSGFKMSEISADKGYIGDSNLLATVRHGAVPYIPFKSNAVEQSKVNPKSAVWVKMYHYYNLRRDDFLEHYHRRSNVETVFSMIKRSSVNGSNVRRPLHRSTKRCARCWRTICAA